MPFDSDTTTPPGARIKVIGVGGGGSNAVNTMIRSGLDGVEFVSANTDVQSLRFSLAPAKLQIGKELTRGLGAGADPDIGRDAALEDRHEIQEYLQGADMVFITAGMGGGTGTGGASVVAQIARELGALTVAVVTKPFAFEGKRRKRHGDAGIARLRECVDTLITIPNQRLLTIASPDLSMVDAFKMADAVLVNAVKGISEIINTPGIVNVDFADVKAVMSCMGQALMGIGVASGEKRAIEAARQAIRSPLLEDVDIEGATGILINIAAGADVKMMEINEACMLVQEAAHEDANIIFGAVIDEALGDNIRVTVIATGFPVDTAEDGLPDGSKMQPVHVAPAYSTRLTTPTYGASAKAAPRTSVTPTHYAPITSRKPETQAKPMPRSPEVKAEPEPAPAPGPTARQEEAASAPRYPQSAPMAGRVELPQSTPVKAPMPAPIAEPAPRIEPPAHSAADESAHLARLTLDNAVLDAFDGGEDFPSLAADGEPKFEPRIEGARVIVDPKDELLSELQREEGTRVGASIFDLPELGEEQREDAAPVAPAADDHAPLEGLFENDPSIIAGDIDRKIDEALELAERLKGPDIKRDEDDLDVPAFLRSNLKDLSLS
jgi:cell division protein FtsZ